MIAALWRREEQRSDDDVPALVGWWLTRRTLYTFLECPYSYLPRIKAVADAFGDQKANIQSGAWDKVSSTRHVVLSGVLGP